jgi:hypothetical protein
VHASPLVLSIVSIHPLFVWDRINTRVHGALAAPEDVDLAELAIDVATDVVVAHESLDLVVVDPSPAAGVLGRRLLTGTGGSDEREESGEKDFKEEHCAF